MGVSEIKNNAFILAAGYGSRLGRISKKVPKTLININGENSLESNIKLCKQYGIDDIYINIHHLSQMIQDRIQDGSNLGVNISYSYEKKILGTAGAVLPIFKNLSNPFFLIYGDNVTNVNLQKLLNFHKKNNSDFTIVSHKLKDVSRSGILEMNSENVVRNFIEKPSENFLKSKWVNSGVYVVNKEAIKGNINVGDDFGKNTIPRLIKLRSKIFAFKIKTKVKAIDTKELLEYEKNKG